MTSWLSRIRGVSGGVPHDSPTTTRAPQRLFTEKPDPPDPNAPVRRLQMHQRCLYERTLPGGAFVSAHVNRLQHGFYETSALHEPALEDVYFVSVHFVFHPYNPRSHRFRSAMIKVSIHGSDPTRPSTQDWGYGPSPNPRILKHAPELMYGAVSPENLQWNFSLSSSLGVSQAPLSASVNPSGGVKSSYKVYDMMSIQGSVRTTRSPLGPAYDVEDGSAVWTLEENKLQRSGLPRDFDFVLLLHKPADVRDIFLTVDVDANVESRFGAYPQWYNNLQKYQPTQDFTLNFDTDIGQRFLPTHPGRGFNFADLPQPLEEYVQMPGTTYPTNDTAKPGNDKMSAQPRAFNMVTQPVQIDGHAIEPAPSSFAHRQQQQQMAPATPTRSPVGASRPQGQYQPTNRHSWAPETLNVRVLLEHQHSQASPQSSRTSRRYSGYYSESPTQNLGEKENRRHSIRRKRSRSDLHQATGDGS